MKFICNKALLGEAVTNVSRFIPAKSSIPSLEGIQIKAGRNSLKLTGYDMEAGITTIIEANVLEEGEIVLSARLFSDMIRKMTGEDVFVTVGDKYLTEIKSGHTEFTILGIPSDEFPELPTVEKGEGILVPQPVLRSMIEQTLFAVAITDTKPVHTGSMFEIKKNNFSLISVDGYRLALRNTVIDSQEDCSFVVPGKVLGEIAKLMEDDEEKKASLMVSRRHIVFEIGSYAIVSRLLEGEFLDYKNSIPAGHKTVVSVPTRSFIESVERASLLISDRLRSPLRVIFDQGKIEILCSTSLGKSYEELECTLTGDRVEMGFNNKYLLDALKAVDSDEVRIELSGPLSPIKILPPQGEDYLFLVLPVRLKNEA